MAIKKSDCVGCRDDFYNHNRMGLNETPDGPQCWMFAKATMVRAKDVHRDLPPPYNHIPLTSRPSCYRAPGFVRVKPENLTADGYWK